MTGQAREDLLRILETPLTPVTITAEDGTPEDGAGCVSCWRDLAAGTPAFVDADGFLVCQGCGQLAAPA